MNLIGFAAMQERRVEAAIEWFRRGLELGPLPGVLEAALAENLAEAYLEVRDLDKAEAFARRAILLTSNTFGSKDLQALSPQKILVAVHLARGDFVNGEPVLRRILDYAEKAYGAILLPGVSCRW